MLDTTSDDLGQPTSYDYWRKHGGEWADEYDWRKTRLVYYHIQELMLASYMEHAAPARVLEYGCGVGRHLSYLRNIPELDIYGYDQSATMVALCRRWASQQWMDEHITVGAPVDRLPYPDQHFDITYTSEVLIHVAPADLETILAEIVRVSKWQVLHFEPSPFAQVSHEFHNGCWNHDLLSVYQKLGYHCELLPSGFEQQAPYRVVQDAQRSLFTWSPVQLALMRRLERDLQPALLTMLEKKP